MTSIKQPGGNAQTKIKGFFTDPANRWLFSGLLPLFLLAHFTFHVLGALLVPLLPIIRDDLRLDPLKSGFLLSALRVTSGFSNLPAGWLGDRFGNRLLITISILGTALAGLLIGFSQNYIMIIVFLILMGVVSGGYHPAASPLIAASVEQKNMGRALGFHLVAGSASRFLAPLIGVAIATAWGWRASYIGLAIPTAIMGVLFYTLLGRYTGREKIGGKKADTLDGTPYTSRQWRRVVVFMVLIISTSALISSTASFIPLFMVDQFQISKELPAIYWAFLEGAGLWGAPLGGYLSDRVGRLPVVLTVYFLFGPVLYLLNVIPYGLGFGALMILIGTLMMMTRPATEAFIISQVPENRRSTMFGIYFFVGAETSSVVIPLIGYLIKRFGYSFTFTASGVTVAVITLACAVFLWFTRERTHQQRY